MRESEPRHGSSLSDEQLLQPLADWVYNPVTELSHPFCAATPALCACSRAAAAGCLMGNLPSAHTFKEPGPAREMESQQLAGNPKCKQPAAFPT